MGEKMSEFAAIGGFASKPSNSGTENSEIMWLIILLLFFGGALTAEQEENIRNLAQKTFDEYSKSREKGGHEHDESTDAGD